MTDRIYPSTKPTPTPTPTPNPPRPQNPTTTPPFPATKPHLRPPYRPQPKPRRRRRSCCCLCCLWTTFLLIALIFLAAIAAGVVYVLYHPQIPKFTISSFKLSTFNLSTNPKTSLHALTSRIDLAVSARNPNSKLVFFFDPASVSVSSAGVGIGDGSLNSFVLKTKNSTVLRGSVSRSVADLDSESAKGLREELKKKTGLNLGVLLESRVRVKMGSVKSGWVGIRVSCDGIRAKANATASVSDSKCEVKLRLKIWKWRF